MAVPTKENLIAAGHVYIRMSFDVTRQHKTFSIDSAGVDFFLSAGMPMLIAGDAVAPAPNTQLANASAFLLNDLHLPAGNITQVTCFIKGDGVVVDFNALPVADIGGTPYTEATFKSVLATAGFLVRDEPPLQGTIPP